MMPMNALARRFGDLLGEANQRLAAVAQDVYWCIAGIPVRIKDAGTTPMR
jgi:adenosylcobinamide kinase/adenosylcobinamide-phosphate guanylyltransferase